MSPQYEFVRYEPAFREEVIRLQRHLWGPDLELNSAYFDWKFVQNPYMDDIAIYLALHDGTVVGMRAMMGAQWQWGQSPQNHLCFCAGDLVVTPEHRGRHLFRPIMNAAIDDLRRRGHQFLFNFSAGPFTFLASIRSGWRTVTPYQTLRWQNPRQKIVKSRRSSLHRLPFLWRFADRRMPLFEPDPERTFEKISKNLSRSARAANIALALEPEPRADAMMDLATRCSGNNDRLHHVKDAAYVQWRYRNPTSRYFFLYGGGSTPSGYLVLKAPRAGLGRHVSLVDWEAEKPEILRSMVAAICGANAFDSISVWSAPIPAEACAIFKELSFNSVDGTQGVKRYTPGPLLLSLREEGGEPDFVLHGRSILERDAWDLRMIYSDAP